MATAARTIPSSSIIYVNTKAFNIETCNATNNIKNFMMQVPGRIMSMVRIGTYDDAVRGDHTFSNRYDHLVGLTQRDHWSVCIAPPTKSPIAVRHYDSLQHLSERLVGGDRDTHGRAGQGPSDVHYTGTPIREHQSTHD